MKKISVFGVFITLLVSTFVIIYGWMIYDKIVEQPRRDEARQQELDDFYVNHKCRPEGYIASRSSVRPIRTYRCDNGLFIAEDMKGK